jgi:putative membrane protein insertion efficiency factor
MGRSKGRRAGLIVALIAAALVGHDVMVPPAQAFGARAALTAISAYRAQVSPHLRGFVVCRLRPTCSVYGYQSIERHGLLAGGAKTLFRIARCGPWTAMGTYDPP